MPTDTAPDPVLAAFKAALAGTTTGTAAGENVRIYGGSSVGQGIAAPDPNLFLGNARAGDNPNPNPSDHPGRNVTTLSQAQMLWYHWSQADRLKWTKYAYSLGYLQSPTDVAGAQQIWTQAIDESVRYFAAGKPRSPWQVLDANAGSNADELKKRGALNPDGSITYTNTSLRLDDKASVEALAITALHNGLGRDPTQSEINTFYNTIRAKEKADPDKTTTTKSATGDSSSVTTPGFNPELYLRHQVQNDPEYAKYQAGTTYFGAAMSALGAIGGA